MAILEQKDTKKIKKYYLKFIKKYKYIFVVLVLLSSISSIISLINPALGGKIIDFALNRQFPEVLRIAMLFLIIFLVNSLLSIIYTYINNYLQNMVICDIKKETYKKIVYLRVEDLDENSIGKYMSFLEGDTNTISSFYITSIISFFTCAITVICSGFFIFKISVKLSLIGLVTLPIMLIINYFFGKTIKKLQINNRKIYDNYTSNIQETFSGLKEIKGLSLENIVEQKNNINLDNIFKVNMKLGKISSFGGFAQSASGFFMQMAVYILGCHMIGNKIITVGSFTAFNNYLNQFITSLQKITNINLSLQSTLVSIDRYEELIESCQVELINEYNDNFTKLKGNITVDNIVFSYKEKKVINGLSINIKSNELVALVGSNGSGKTTFFNLLMGFYKCAYGKILFDNKNIIDMDIFNLRKNITYIQQYPFLFNDTIKNNLLVAKSNATDEELREVCKRVYLYDTILNLPEGFDTVIGERGFRLSGGQRQQLAIARGILKNSKIFLLDEITSNIDGITEKYILNTVNELSINHTVIIVAHRSTTIVNMPRIIVFDKGKNIAEGIHSELLQDCQVYKKLFKEINEAEN